MEKYKNYSKKNKTGLIITAIVSVIELLCSVFSIIGVINDDAFAFSLNLDISILNIVCYIAIMCYAFFGYRRPHGNMLRFLYVFSACVLICRAIILNTYVPKEAGFKAMFVGIGATAFSAVLLSYVGGRLNKFNKNKAILAVISVMLFVSNVIESMSYSGKFNLFASVETFGSFVLVICLTVIYVARYEEHREAGLETP